MQSTPSNERHIFIHQKRHQTTKDVEVLLFLHFIFASTSFRQEALVMRVYCRVELWNGTPARNCSGYDQNFKEKDHFLPQDLRDGNLAY